jgi:peroxiredoxin
MTIQVGDRVPAVTFKYLGSDGMTETSTEALFAGKKVVLFSVPGAFTPTCSAKHLPSFIKHADELKAKGVDEIVCMSVNDPFVMKAWAEHSGATDAVFMLPDGNGTFARALGLEYDGTGYGLGKRSQRFALVAEDGKVTHLAVEKPGAYEVSSAESVLASL